MVDLDQPRAAPPHFPYRDHQTMQEVMDEQYLEWLTYGFSPEDAAEKSGVSVADAHAMQALLEVS